MNLGKKIIILFLIFILGFEFIAMPRPVYATLPTIDWTHVGFAIGQFVREVYEWTKDNYQRILRDVVAKRIIDYIVDQTVVWIQGGGKPQFITNWDGFLKSAEDIAFESVVNEVGLGFLCSPFKLQVRLSLLPVPIFSRKVTCTLDKIVKNIEDFYEDFGKGGWLAYNEAWQPQNNYFGMMLIAQDEITTRSAVKVNASQNEARASGGFLGVKQCVEYDDETLKVCIDNYNPPDEKPGDAEAYCKKYMTSACTKEEIVTPGTAVGQAVGSAITSDKEWAANITSWTSALVNALINKYAKEGLAKLTKSKPNPKPDYYPPEYQQWVNSSFNEDKKTMVKEPQKFIGEWQYLLSAKNKSLSYSQQQKEFLEKLKLTQSATSSQPLPADCLPLVADIEIQTASSTIDILIVETQNLQAKIDEANSLINMIESANFSDTQQRSLAQNAYLNFMDKYNISEFQAQIISGDARNAADLEVSAKKGELDASQGRLNSCFQAQYQQCLTSGQPPAFCSSTYSTSTPPLAP